mmetsp:Transcript_18750/g.30718  ORF Transcript_18750/g.30718 Transcript_18750/m.30718 type:complete len:252 (-) Transcript_18750:486-1241(-)
MTTLAAFQHLLRNPQLQLRHLPMKAMNSMTLVDFRLLLLNLEPQLKHRKEPTTKTSATLVTFPYRKPKTTKRKNQLKVINLSIHNLLLKTKMTSVNLVISLRLKKLHPQIISQLPKSKRAQQKAISPIQMCNPHKQLPKKMNLETLEISRNLTMLLKPVVKRNQVDLFMCLMKMFVTCSRKCFMMITPLNQIREIVVYNNSHSMSLCAQYLHHANQTQKKRETAKSTRVKRKSRTLQSKSSLFPHLLHPSY